MYGYINGGVQSQIDLFTTFALAQPGERKSRGQVGWSRDQESLTALFKHIESVEEPITDDNLRERTLVFIRDKVFPLKSELLKPPSICFLHVIQVNLVTILMCFGCIILQSVQDVTGAEFKMFMDFLRSLSIFGEKAPTERVQELVEIIEGQADLDARFSVSDGDHVDRLISCLYMALPFFVRGASSSEFLNYLNKHILPVFDKPLHSKSPSFIGDKRINLSWNVAVKTVAPANTVGGKRPANATNGSNNQANKRSRGGSNQPAERAFESQSYGGRGGSRGGGQGRGRGGCGRGYYR
nr:hypothetical protein [Tanacetum cinerariifolium]